jgi:hypothetical protein
LTQHLAVLEAAKLISTVRSGRLEVHHLNPVPIHEIQRRWIDGFDEAGLEQLAVVRRRAEEQMTDRPSFIYVIYIHSTPDAVWTALTDAELTAEYWGRSNVSDWQAGSPWELDGPTGARSPTSSSPGRRPGSSPPGPGLPRTDRTARRE